MNRAGEHRAEMAGGRLPGFLRTYFWDCDFSALRWPDHGEFVLSRLLRTGGWDAVRWLRDRAGDPAVEDWIVRHRGRGMSPERLRFWGLVLDLPRDEVDEWISSSAHLPWSRRTA